MISPTITPDYFFFGKFTQNRAFPIHYRKKVEILNLP